MSGKTHCPHCGAALRLPEQFLGQRVACGICGQVFTCAAELGLTGGPAALVAGESAPSSAHAASMQPSPVAPPRVEAAAAPSTGARVIRCPYCAAALCLLPQARGKEIRCSRCHQSFHTKVVMPPSPAPVKADREQVVPPPFKRRAPRRQPLSPEEEPPLVLPEERELARRGSLPRRSSKPGRGNYPMVRTGLTLNLVATAILLGTFALGLLAVLASVPAIYAATDTQKPPEARPEPSGALPAGSIVLATLLVIGQGVDIVGLGFCLGAPRKDAARWLALACVVAAAAGLSLACGGGVMLMTASAGAAGGTLLTLGILLVCGSKVLYLVFLRALGLAMEVLTLANQVHVTMVVVFLAGLLHLTVLAASSFGLTGDILGVVSGQGTGTGLQDVTVTVLLLWGASLLILLYALLRFIITINDARGVVVYHLARGHEAR